MLKKLKARINKVGMAQVAADLGYKSSNSIYAWLKNKKIPDIAKPRVKDYLS